MDPLLIQEIARMLREELRMLRAEIREAFSDSMRAAEHVPVCSPPFVPILEVEVVDDGPSFDGCHSPTPSLTQHPTSTPLRSPRHIGVHCP
jgi:hypothetical protein